MPPRVVIHAGFHKTGTTTLQSLLRENKRLLSNHMQIFLREDMIALCTAARKYSKTRSGVDLGLVRYELADILESDASEAPVILLSSEDLSGFMPGRRGLKTYDAAPTLMTALRDAVFAVFPKANLTFLFTTRASQAWLKSCYAQHLKVIRMTLSEPEYLACFSASSALDDVVDEISLVVQDARINRVALEEKSPTGLAPLDRVLDLTDTPSALRTALPATPVVNQSPDPARLAELLSLNRSGLNAQDLKMRKKALSSGRQ